MPKSANDKNRFANNFYKKIKTLKEEYKIKENLYSDSLCRLIKDVSRQLNRNQTEEGIFEAKRKTVELSLVATEELFRKMAQNCSRVGEYQKIISEINKISERKTKKKCEVIAAVNYVRRLIKGIEISNQMNNLNSSKQ